MSRFEYNHAQWFLPFLRGSWKMPECDVMPGMRYLDQSEVHFTRPANWEESQETINVANDRIALPKPWRKGRNQGGRAMQLAHPRDTRKFHILDSYGPYYDEDIAKPKHGSDHWIEGNPRPLWQMQNVSTYDRHIILVHPDGGSTELIGTFYLNDWHARGHGLWRDGELIRGRPVTAGKNASMASRLLRRGEYNHVVSLTVRGRDDVTPFFPWLEQRLALNPDLAPKPKDEEQELFISQLIDYGVSVDDHGGRTNISGAEGSDWDGSTLYKLDLRLNMFDVVVS